MALPTTVIYFVGYEHLRNYVREFADRTHSEQLRVYSPLIAGGVARGELAVLLLI